VRYDRLPTCCALIQLGFGGRQVSTVSASIATSIRASQLTAPLPRMLEQIEADRADVKVSAVEKWRLRQRAGLVCGLLTGD
jgi:hypothetical protein